MKINNFRGEFFDISDKNEEPLVSGVEASSASRERPQSQANITALRNRRTLQSSTPLMLAMQHILGARVSEATLAIKRP